MRPFRGPASFLVAISASLCAHHAAAQCPDGWENQLALSGVGTVVSLRSGPDAELVAGGTFEIATPNGTLRNIAVFQWPDWLPLGSGIDYTLGVPQVRCVEIGANGEFYVAGTFDRAGETEVSNIAVWTNGDWSTLGLGIFSNGFPTQVQCLAILPNGNLIAGGTFGNAGGVAVNNIARWDGSEWHRLGNGIPRINAATSVDTMLVMRNGDVVVAGNFQFAGTTAAANVARWDGASWHALGGGIDDHIKDIAEFGNHELLAIGSSLHRWDGERWGLFDPAPPDGTFRAVSEFFDDTIILGGSSVQFFNGDAWIPVIDDVELFDLLAFGSGDLYVAGRGYFQSAKNLLVANWYNGEQQQICVPPRDTSVCYGGSASFEVGAVGWRLEYEWIRDGESLSEIPGRIEGVNTPRLTISNVTFADEQSEFQCLVGGSGPSEISNPVRVSICIGELNCVGPINQFDLAILLANFGTPAGAEYLDGDLTRDGAVNLDDLAIMLKHYGQRCD